MKIICLLFALKVFIPFCAASDNLQITRIRGIPLELKAFYDPLKEFQCLDGSMKLPFSYVNDDYCDCGDGSDEPGTSACPNSSYYCVNLMHVGLNVPSSRVNDGICDCCDGSDEYASTVTCPNTCEELGRAAREEAKRREELLTQGGQLRNKMVAAGKEKVEEAKHKLDQVKTQLEEAQGIRDVKEAARKEAEDAERKHLDDESARNADSQKDKQEVDNYLEEDKRKAEETFQELDANEDGVLTFTEMQENIIFDQNKDGTVCENEAKFFLAYKEECDMQEFASTAWPLVKPVWFMSRSPPPALPDVDDPPTEAPHEDILEDEDEEIDDDVDHPAAEEEEDLLAEPPNITETPEEKPRDPAVKAAVEVADKARAEYQDAERKHKDLEQELNQLESIINGDFGEEAEFATMRGECFEFTDREYTYKMCPFDKSSQRPKDGGSETSLGRWARWEGSESNKYSKMKFEGGNGCWNGPARSTAVVVTCGLENKLIGASEPSRCEYQFEFSSPAACTPGSIPSSAQASSDHDEL